MQLEPTGERMIEEFYRSSPENYLIYLFHIATYNYARQYASGHRVLDYGCGSGYGTHHIASCCNSIVGIDVAGDAVEHARTHYQADNLSFQRINTADHSPLPFEDSSFDTVLSFQVIEHIVNIEPYLSEINRVLKPSGVFVCATPNRSSRLFPGQKPWNMWHVHEYDAFELEHALAPHFSETKVLHMGGRPDVIGIEIRRTRKVKWMTLPFTLPFVRDALRIRGLKFLKQLAGQRNQKPVTSPQEFLFDESALWITESATPSVNLVAVAKKMIGHNY